VAVSVRFPDAPVRSRTGRSILKHPTLKHLMPSAATLWVLHIGVISPQKVVSPASFDSQFAGIS